MNYLITDSPIGALTLSANQEGITGLHIEGDKYFTEIPSDWKLAPADPVLLKASAELAEYFAGTRTAFRLKLAAEGTPFQKTVWEALMAIPSGGTTTYGAIAAAIGKPAASRAVGTAIGKNPICIIVPCHRVLASDGGLGGFVVGVERKKKLLETEA